jgi:hypothetical protein
MVIKHDTAQAAVEATSRKPREVAHPLLLLVEDRKTNPASTLVVKVGHPPNSKKG